MSRDTDSQQRLWNSLGYGGKNSEPTTWRYWKGAKDSRSWVISAPNNLAQFEQHDKTVFYMGKAIVTAVTQWSATWRSLAYFYEEIVPTLTAPPLSAKGLAESCSRSVAKELVARGATDGDSFLSQAKTAPACPAKTSGINGEVVTTYLDKLWIGPAYSKQRILVLGESWYGDPPDGLVTDEAYIHAYLEGRVVDAMYSRIANACEVDRTEFWNSIVFTNFVQRVGATRNHRPTAEQYKSACERLARILEEQEPLGVWILGVQQGKYSAPVVERTGIAYEVSAHPTSRRGLTNAALGLSWRALIARSQSRGPSQ